MLNAGCPKAFFQAHSEEFLEGAYVCVDSSQIMFRLTDVPDADRESFLCGYLESGQDVSGYTADFVLLTSGQLLAQMDKDVLVESIQMLEEKKIITQVFLYT